MSWRPLALVLLATRCATTPPPRADAPPPEPAAEATCPTAPPKLSGAPAAVLGATIEKVCLIGAGDGTYLRLHETIAPREGTKLEALGVREDLEALFELGMVRDASAVAQPSGPGRVVLSYFVSEYPVVARVKLKGVTAFMPDTIFEAAPAGHWASPHELQGMKKAVTKLYLAHGFGDVNVEAAGSTEVTLEVTEGVQTTVQAVRFVGVKQVPEAELAKALTSMIGAPFRQELADTDAFALTAVYYDHGLVNARVEPDARPLPRAGALELVFTVTEGVVFKFGKLALKGVSVGPEKDVLKSFESKPGAIFSRSTLRRDIDRLRARAKKQGVEVDVTPLTEVDAEKKTVGVTLEVARVAQ